MSDDATTDRAAKRPTWELRRKVGPGYYQSLVVFYWRPTALWVLGRWVIRP